jgi:twitching motility two-component system response regulator PilG
VIFPQDENEEPAAQPSPSGPRNPLPPIAQDLVAKQARTVLVVDQSSAERDLIQRVLQEEHFHVIFANDTRSGLASIATHHPHLILLSIQLARVDGYHLCRMIRKKPHLARLPVIIFGVQKNPPFDVMRGRLAGATDFLSKPFDSHQLVQMVKKYLPD